ncbi:hypothetical protein NIES4102_29050 [Chondrocystis sp. NIES-4102]|nr:hypothetical protein NIES4102_29050 [Chondrocystis sp. NIES-4102]
MSSKEVKIDDCEKVLLLRINKRYHKNISKEELYEATRGIWKINQLRANNVEYAFALFEGIIIEVYKINQWYKAGTLKYSFTDTSSFANSGRWEFKGEIADNNLIRKYRGKSVRKYFKPGNQNPIKYVNC